MLQLYYENDDNIECGIDEAGAGCLAGRLFTACVILPKKIDSSIDPDNLCAKIKDSKKLSKKLRTKLYDFITTKLALDYSIVYIEPEEIDKINILRARLKSYTMAVNELKIKPNLILVDGPYFNTYYDSFDHIIKHHCIIEGDSKYLSIAAASILAKVSKDNYMGTIHKEYPMYNWDKNSGYGTKLHHSAILNHGISIYHRKTYGICKNY